MTAPTYGDYEVHGPSNGPLGAALAAKLVDVISGVERVRSVCDLGCGNGYLSGLLARRGLEVVGVDASDTGIALAREAHGVACRFLNASIDEALPGKLAGARFDTVVSSDVIEHMYLPRDLLRCALGLLNPGGILVVGTPYHGYVKNLALSVLNRWDRHFSVGWDGGHIKFFSVASLQRMVEETGFEVERFEFFGRLPLLWTNMICIARAGRS